MRKFLIPPSRRIFMPQDEVEVPLLQNYYFFYRLKRPDERTRRRIIAIMMRRMKIKVLFDENKSERRKIN